MSNQEYSADTFFGKYEHIIRQQLGKELDGFKKSIGSFIVLDFISCACFLYVLAKQTSFPIAMSLITPSLKL